MPSHFETFETFLWFSWSFFFFLNLFFPKFGSPHIFLAAEERSSIPDNNSIQVEWDCVRELPNEDA